MDTGSRRTSLEAAGQWLRQQRERRGFKAGEFARLLGVDPSQLSRYERGMAAVSDERAAQIAEVLRLPEIEVRRGLGLWVPDSGEPEPHEPNEPLEHVLLRYGVPAATAREMGDYLDTIRERHGVRVRRRREVEERGA